MPAVLRHDWSRAEVLALLDLPFPELMARAGAVHREHFDPARGAGLHAAVDQDRRLPRDCAYCPQAARYDTGLKAHKLLRLDEVVEKASAAKAAGRDPLLHGRGLALAQGQGPGEGRRDGRRGEGAGHGNLRHAGHAQPGPGGNAQGRRAWTTTTTTSDSAPEFYGDIIHTREYQDRLDTLAQVRGAGPEDLLRRHRRHGRDARAARRPAADAGEPARASRLGADQPPGAGRGHAAARHRAARSLRVRAHDRRSRAC
jgi:biotin synthase